MKLRIAATALFALPLIACSTTKKLTREPADPIGFETLAQRAAVDEMMRNFHRVRFEFDSALITDDTRQALTANAEIMHRFEQIAVEVEGHCDEQGSTEYNLALGQRRADAIQKYLLGAGVESGRLATISYGEERPLMTGVNEMAFSMNRRAEFRVTIDPMGAVHGTTDEIKDSPSTLAQW